MAKAIWKGVVLAESDQYEMVEGNVYFPPQSVKWEYFREGDMKYTCPWKGKAAYYDIVVKGEVNKNVAWSYPEPKKAAKHITRHVAFGSGVEVQK